MESLNQSSSGTHTIKASGPEALNARRDVITQLYWDEDRDRVEVMDIMQHQYRFKATERQYKDAFKRWGLQKNATSADMRHMVRIRKRRFEEDGKTTEFSLCKRRVPDAKIDRFVQRTGLESRMMMSVSSMTGETPPAIDYKTPSECNSDAGTPLAPQEDDMLDLSPLGVQLEGMATLNLYAMQDPNTSPKDVPSLFHLVPTNIPTGASNALEESAQAPASDDVPRVSVLFQPDDVSRQYGTVFATREHKEQDQNEPTNGHQQSTIRMHGLEPQANLNEARSEQVELEETRDFQLGEDDDLFIIDKETFERSVESHVGHALSQPVDKKTPGGCLRAAARRGDRLTVQRILRFWRRAVDSRTDIHYPTALHSAVLGGYGDIVKDLLKARADPCLRWTYPLWTYRTQQYKINNASALELAILSNDTNVLNILISPACFGHFDRPMFGQAVSVIGQALRFALGKAQPPCLEILINCALQLHNFDWDGIVCYAISNYHFEGLQTLVRHGIDISSVGSLAIPCGWIASDRILHLRMLEFLLHNGLRSERKDDFGCMLLDLMTSLVFLVTPDSLVPWNDQYLRVIKALLGLGLDPNTLSIGPGNALLHLACLVKYLPSKWHLARMFLAFGANPNLRNEEGATPLHTVCSLPIYFDSDIVKLLLENGADPNICDLQGITPLHMMLRSHRRPQAQRVIELLVEHGAKLDVRDSKGETALHMAIRNWRRISSGNFRMLLEKYPGSQFQYRKDRLPFPPLSEGIPCLLWPNATHIMELLSMFRQLKLDKELGYVHIPDLTDQQLESFLKELSTAIDDIYSLNADGSRSQCRTSRGTTCRAQEENRRSLEDQICR